MRDGLLKNQENEKSPGKKKKKKHCHGMSSITNLLFLSLLRPWKRERYKRKKDQKEDEEKLSGFLHPLQKKSLSLLWCLRLRFRGFGWSNASGSYSFLHITWIETPLNSQIQRVNLGHWWTSDRELSLKWGSFPTILQVVSRQAVARGHCFYFAESQSAKQIITSYTNFAIINQE